MARILHETHAYPVAALCRLLDVPRSRYYYLPTVPQNEAVKTAVQAVEAEFPTYGSRRIVAQLRRAPIAIIRGPVIGRFMQQLYQHKRIQSALGYLTPAEFDANWRQQHPLS